MIFLVLFYIVYFWLIIILNSAARKKLGDRIVDVTWCILNAVFFLFDVFSRQPERLQVFQGVILFLMIWVTIRDWNKKNRKRAPKWLGNKGLAAKAKLVNSIPKSHTPVPLTKSV